MQRPPKEASAAPPSWPLNKLPQFETQSSPGYTGWLAALAGCPNCTGWLHWLEPARCLHLNFSEPASLNPNQNYWRTTEVCYRISGLLERPAR